VTRSSELSRAKPTSAIVDMRSRGREGRGISVVPETQAKPEPETRPEQEMRKPQAVREVWEPLDHPSKLLVNT